MPLTNASKSSLPPGPPLRVRHAELIFEAVPETRDAKAAAFAWLSTNAPRDCILASTTSTFLVSDIADLTEEVSEYSMRTVEPGASACRWSRSATAPRPTPTPTDRLCAILQSIGKVPTRMGAAPGYVVPRIQALAMNEAARMVEEGVGTAEEIDKAIRLGIGLRFAVLGMLEFIDWGGGDILYHASNYLAGAVSEDRYQLRTSSRRTCTTTATACATGVVSTTMRTWMWMATGHNGSASSRSVAATRPHAQDRGPDEPMGLPNLAASRRLRLITFAALYAAQGFLSGCSSSRSPRGWPPTVTPPSRSPPSLAPPPAVEPETYW